MYTFKNTEINNKKASEFEAKSLLYLIGMRADRDEIDILTIDCFNDVTGANSSFSKLWDVQSKNHKLLPPSVIGESLYTLYDNYISSIHFSEYILFIPKLKREYLVDASLNTYEYRNIKPDTQRRIEKKLTNKINGSTKGKPPPLLMSFLSDLTFVEDNKKISTYIKKIAKFKNKKVISEDLYESIFREIRDAQTALKNSYIENESIKEPSEVLKFKRHITKNEINTLLISRLVGVEVFSFPGIPIPFLPVVKNMDVEEATDVIQDCNENLSRAFFDKNGCKVFWKVSEFIIAYLKGSPKEDISKVYDTLKLSISVTATTYLTPNTILYMIALVKTGLNDEG